jgi:methylated-DNA-[protein]-cysteine S-methyltransferase
MVSKSIGKLLPAGTKAGLKMVSFSSGTRTKGADAGWHEDSAVFTDVVDQLKSYFAGERKAFDLPLVLEGTEFQKKVWTALQDIPYGETVSYKALAQRVGSPKAVRAVGAANGESDSDYHSMPSRDRE